MKQVLFVDDEPKVLEGLRRMLYPLRREWQIAFAGGGLEALQMLDQMPVDVLVTDIQMPGMSGIELLTEVVKRHPQVVRMVLSGTADQASTMRSVLLAHQYLVKPCDAESLKATVGRVFSLRQVLQDPALQRLISRIHALPSMPSSYLRLIDALRSPDVSAADIGAIIAQDMAMTAKVLQLINSSFFGVRRQITDAKEAVLYLGIDTVRALTLSVSAFSQFEARSGSLFSMEELRTQALAVAALARNMGKTLGLGKSSLDDAFAAGLLHDIGRLVLASNYPKEYDMLLRHACTSGGVRRAEQDAFGTTHAEVGAHLLWLWGLPGTVVEAIALHHNPAAAGRKSDTVALVHIADALVQHDAEGMLDEAAVDAMGWTNELPKWRWMAKEMTQGVPVS